MLLEAEGNGISQSDYGVCLDVLEAHASQRSRSSSIRDAHGRSQPSANGFGIVPYANHISLRSKSYFLHFWEKTDEVKSSAECQRIGSQGK
jgi:hypothetical protein